MGISPRKKMPLSSPPFREHSYNKSYPISLNSFSIKTQSPYNLKLLEELLIHKLKPILNINITLIHILCK